jgi:hypothetical protein
MRNHRGVVSLIHSRLRLVMLGWGSRDAILAVRRMGQTMGQTRNKQRRVVGIRANFSRYGWLRVFRIFRNALISAEMCRM